MNQEDKIKDFLVRLQTLSNETGIYIEEYDDPFYRPKLEFIGEDVEEGYYLTLHDGKLFNKNKTYNVRKENPYDGDIVD